jgi:hypothetical protein
MLIEQTLTMFHSLKLTDMATALAEQRGIPDLQLARFQHVSCRDCCVSLFAGFRWRGDAGTKTLGGHT